MNASEKLESVVRTLPAVRTEFKAMKAMTLNGVKVAPGEPVDLSALDPGKVTTLFSLGYVGHISEVAGSRGYRANPGMLRAMALAARRVERDGVAPPVVAPESTEDAESLLGAAAVVPAESLPDVLPEGASGVASAETEDAASILGTAAVVPAAGKAKGKK